jgi:hypothetical protein
MKTFKKILSKLRGKKEPGISNRPGISVFHGSSEPRSSLALPKVVDKRNADGHATYLSTSKNEASDYGKHIHHVTFHATHDELVNLDGPHGSQPKAVKEVLAKHKIPIGGGGEHSYQKTAIGLDYYHRLAHKLGGDDKASAEFRAHGIKGGYGESLPKSGEKTTVYSSYAPEKDTTVHKVEMAEKKK